MLYIYALCYIYQCMLYRLCMLDFITLVNGKQFMMTRFAKMKTEVTN